VLGRVCDFLFDFEVALNEVFELLARKGSVFECSIAFNQLLEVILLFGLLLLPSLQEHKSEVLLLLDEFVKRLLSKFIGKLCGWLI
jgi:hypothetical protein